MKEVFSKVGEVREIRLTTNAMTKRNEGFAFVRYGTVEEARRALDLKGSVVCCPSKVYLNRCGLDLFS